MLVLVVEEIWFFIVVIVEGIFLVDCNEVWFSVNVDEDEIFDVVVFEELCGFIIFVLGLNMVFLVVCKVVVDSLFKIFIIYELVFGDWVVFCDGIDVVLDGLKKFWIGWIMVVYFMWWMWMVYVVFDEFFM